MDGYALLFEMNVLFEEYVTRLLARALSGTGLRVTGQGGHRDCLFEGKTGRFRTRPDVIVRRGNRIALIIDTKWKRIAGTDDPKQGVTQADVYQLLAYGRIYDCSDVVLLYPHHSALPPEPIRRPYSIARPDAQERLTVATLDVTGSRRSHEKAFKELVDAASSRCLM